MKRIPPKWITLQKRPSTQEAFTLFQTFLILSGGWFLMLRYALVALIIAIIAGIVAFGGIAFAAAGIAKILFAIFLVLFLVGLIMHLGRGGRAI
jgi:uncharacterized membrane protein YtjA (UPF0391 family)